MYCYKHTIVRFVGFGFNGLDDIILDGLILKCIGYLQTEELYEIHSISDCLFVRF